MNQIKAHERNTTPMGMSARCGAKTRSGKTCRSPAVTGKKRCRMHGGAEGSGAPTGNQNAFKHGFYSKAAIEERRAMKKLIGEAKSFLNEIKDLKN